jgi:site-specific recombinase XerC
MILLAYRHGLRVSELVGLRWDMVDLDQGAPAHAGRGAAMGHVRSPAPISGTSVSKEEVGPGIGLAS